MLTEDLAVLETEHVLHPGFEPRRTFINDADKLMSVFNGYPRLVLELAEDVCLGELGDTLDELIVQPWLAFLRLGPDTQSGPVEVLQDVLKAVHTPQVVFLEHFDHANYCIGGSDGLHLRLALHFEEVGFINPEIFQDGDEWTVIDGQPASNLTKLCSLPTEPRFPGMRKGLRNLNLGVLLILFVGLEFVHRRPKAHVNTF